MRSPGAVLLAVGAALLLCACGRNTFSAPWRLVSSAPAQDSVVVDYFHGDCDRLDRADVTRTGSSVRIRIVLTGTARTCDDLGKVTAIRVRLGGPLGSRSVLGQCTPGGDAMCDTNFGPVPSTARLTTVGPH